MTADQHQLRKGIEILVLEDSMRLFRVVGEPGSPSFDDAFRSHYELDRPPRGPENRAAAIHMALSMFDRRDVAVQLAARVPKLGKHISTLDLRPGLGICVAKTGGPAHWSVWGRPAQLVSCVADIEEVMQ